MSSGRATAGFLVFSFPWVALLPLSPAPVLGPGSMPMSFFSSLKGLCCLFSKLFLAGEMVRANARVARDVNIP